MFDPEDEAQDEETTVDDSDYIRDQLTAHDKG